MTETPYQPLGHTQQQEEEPTGWKAKLIIASVIIGAIFAFVSLILASVAFSQMAGFSNDYDSTVESWETAPITEIMWVNAAVCPNGYEAVRGSWPGTSDACDCAGVFNATTTDRGSCTSDQLSKGCTPQDGLPSVPLDVFKDIILCVQRQGHSALTRPADPIGPDYSCPVGYSVCGTNTSGAICFDSTLPCPITDMGFLQNQVNSNLTYDDGSSQINFPAGGSPWFYIKRGGTLNAAYFNLSSRSPGSFPSTNLPLTNLRFQPADPCTLSGCGYGGRSSEYSDMERAYNLSQDVYGYMLNSFPCDGGCTLPDVDNSVSPTGRDIRYFRTTNISERLLYQRYSAIPSAYVTSNNYLWYLSARSEILWAATCPQTRSDVQSHQTDVDNVRSAQLALLFFTLLAFLFISLIFPCLQYFQKDKYQRVKKYEKPCKYGLKIAALTCTLVTMIIALGTLNFWDSINNYNKGNDSGAVVLLGDNANSCSDSLTDETFSALGDTFFKLSNKNIINTASMSFTTAFDAVNEVIQKCF